mmetsp:Transcript_32552/g.79222  ORF Transcript_32552/g.79222 Transcript_32552/m.79222 type:complete len:166 (+) Transcript_32552:862-1359(+)
MNLSKEVGPTQFCMGTSYLCGLDVAAHLEDISDERLLDELSEDQYARAFFPDHDNDEEEGEDLCPPSHVRTPLLNEGDMLLFDYTLLHRGGQNGSPSTRPLLYFTFSRPNYRDSNFNREVSASKYMSTRSALPSAAERSSHSKQNRRVEEEITKFAASDLWHKIS